MGNAKAEKEELKKLEDEAYFELCQIIAEAMQLQDIELLDFRIASWKNKYKKLLDNPSPEFKKRIEYLLNEYYSSVTQYIQSQIKFRENKRIENQSKALRELYVIIRDTDDLKTLEKKVDAWKQKYPKDKFLKMYQSKYERMTSRKNLKENAFDQEMAFKDLVDITKHTGTFDDFSKEREQWEKKYSIHSKFELDDFIRNQSEVKRYSSDEYLHSISRENEVEKKEVADTHIPETKENSDQHLEQPTSIYSDLDKQAAAYSKLLSISAKRNNINEMFKWVYKNSSIKFNDKYKELILSATYLDYSPTYLNKLKTPNLNVNNKSLSYEEFDEIDDIKKYAIISYFNLLLPPNKTISNNFFNSCINTVYAKSEEAKHASSSLNEIPQENLRNGIEIKLSKSDAEQEFDLPELKKQNIPDTDVKGTSTSEIEEKQEEDIEPEKKLQEDLSAKPEISSYDVPVMTDLSDKIETVVEKDITNESSKNVDELAIEKEMPKETSATVNEHIEEKIIEEKSITANEPTEEKVAEGKPIIQAKVIEEELSEKLPDNQKQTMPIDDNSTTPSIEEKPKKEKLLDSPEKTVEKSSEIDISPSESFKEQEKTVVEDLELTKDSESTQLHQSQIITISPLLFSVINYKSKQAEAIEKIDEHVDDYVLSSSKIMSDNIQTKQKTDWD